MTVSRVASAQELLIVGAGPVGLTRAAELARYGNEDLTMLVRPDGYVGMCAAAGDWLEVETYLQKIG
jgi:ketopantoate reductase